MNPTASIPFQAACYRGPEDVVLREIEFDKVLPTERVIHIDACGICGTDINAILRGSPDYLRLGHEVAGRVIAEDGALSETRVVLESSSACGRCHACRNGRPEFCTDVKSFFHRPYLGMAERMVSPEISVLAYQGMEPAVATLSEPLAVAIDLCEVAGLMPYSTVLVMGLGPIGLMAVRLAKLAGAARIYAATFSKRKRRNELALEFGADELLYEDEAPLHSRRLDPAPDRILITAPPPSIAASVAPRGIGRHPGIYRRGPWRDGSGRASRKRVSRKETATAQLLCIARVADAHGAGASAFRPGGWSEIDFASHPVVGSRARDPRRLPRQKRGDQGRRGKRPLEVNTGRFNHAIPETSACPRKRVR
jgi:D-arabinose 1-dehydrogenase-like Zn-dependent alcohol dehydrogenase